MTRPDASMRHQRSSPGAYHHPVSPAADRSARSLVARFRSLTGGRSVRDRERPTLVALSGGPDSSGLLIALARRSKAPLVAAHIRHGLRPDHLQNQDRAAAMALAEQLAVPFVTRDLPPMPRAGNREALARKGRYRLLAQIAAENSIPFVVTAHHAEDQLETMLMALLRGSGPRGLAGIREARPLAAGVTLLRPALTVRRTGLRAICDAEGFAPAHDETNEDLSRTRARIRSLLTPFLLENAYERLPERLAGASSLLTGACELVRRSAEAAAGHATSDMGRVELRREHLAGLPDVAVGETLRILAARLDPALPLDRLTHHHLAPVLRRVREQSEHAKSFTRAGLRFTVSRQSIRIEPYSEPV